MYWMCSVPWSVDTAHEYRHVLCMRIWSLGDTMHVPLLTSPIMSGWGEFMYCYVDISVRFEYEMCESVPNTIGCQFNVAHYDMILHTALQCMKQAINQRLKSQNTPHILTWWCHQMETFPHYWPFVWGIHWSLVNSPYKGQWRGALMFSLICTRISSWVNNPETGVVGPCRAHYVTVMIRGWVIGCILWGFEIKLT